MDKVFVDVTRVVRDIKRGIKSGSHEMDMRYEKEEDGVLKLLNQYRDPESFIVKGIKLYAVKRLILKFMRVFTRIQLVFNYYVVELFKEIRGELKQHGAMLSDIRDMSYKSKYFYKDADKFYVYQQNVFRGSYEDIYRRQSKYVKYLQDIPEVKRKYEFVDIGCGRGEFLELLEHYGFKNIKGIDTNLVEIGILRKKGYDVENKDVIDYLEGSNSKLVGVSAFQVVEHLPFEKVYDFLYLSYKRLLSGGVIIIETPNIENVHVSATTFYYDHTHKTKLLPKMLRLMCEFVGFKDIEIVYSAPLKKGKIGPIHKMLYGNRDYAIIAYK